MIFLLVGVGLFVAAVLVHLFWHPNTMPKPTEEPRNKGLFDPWNFDLRQAPLRTTLLLLRSHDLRLMVGFRQDEKTWCDIFGHILVDAPLAFALIRRRD
jgi:hypothetical protein